MYFLLLEPTRGVSLSVRWHALWKIIDKRSDKASVFQCIRPIHTHTHTQDWIARFRGGLYRRGERPAKWCNTILTSIYRPAALHWLKRQLPPTCNYNKKKNAQYCGPHLCRTRGKNKQ